MHTHFNVCPLVSATALREVVFVQRTIIHFFFWFISKIIQSRQYKVYVRFVDVSFYDKA